MRKQLKALLLTMAFACAAHTASAQDLYIGGTAGVGALDTTFKTSNSITGERFKTHGGGTSFIGGGIIGLEHTFCNSLYTAVEARALYDSFSETIRSSHDASGAVNHSVHLKNDFIWGGDVKLGVTLDCCVTPYLLGGVEVGKWKAHVRNNSETPSFGLAPFSSASRSKDRCAAKVGCGVRFPLCDIFAADFQYSYSWFGSFKSHLTDPVTGDTWHSKTHINQHKFMISLNYAFSFLSCF